MVDKLCISTVNHRRFNPTVPTAEDIDIDDIAHALSMITRANGHFTEFFSVARHSINCAAEAKARGYTQKVQLLCLMHDAAEAYIGDMTRPLKLAIPYFSVLEKEYQKLIFKKYATLDVNADELSKVRSIDDSMLYHEFKRYNGEILLDEEPEINIEIDASVNTIEKTKAEFLKLFHELSSK